MCPECLACPADRLAYFTAEKSWLPSPDIHLHPHLFGHTMAHRYLEDNGNDLVGLAQLLGRESLKTTSRYCKQTQEQLAVAAERLAY